MKALAVTLDILTVVLIAVPILLGMLRGFKRCVLSTICAVVSAITAFSVSSIIAPGVYARYFKSDVNALCVQAVESFDPSESISGLLAQYGIDVSEEELRNAVDSAGSIQQAAENAARDNGADEEKIDNISSDVRQMIDEKLPVVIRQSMPEPIAAIASEDISYAKLEDASKMLAQSPEAAAEHIESQYAGPICTSAVRSVLYVLIMAVVRLMMELVLRIFGFDPKAKAKSAGDRALGALVGLVSGAVYAVILIIAVGFVETASDGLFDIQALGSVIFLPLFNIIY